jgi:ketosteroid isomerase-like protein
LKIEELTMLKRIAFTLLLTFAFASLVQAQTANTPAPSTRKRTVAANPPPAVSQEGKAQTAPAKKTATENKQSGTSAKNPATGGNSVLDTFNALLDGIRAADVKVVTGIYWNSPQLVLFNNNGTVTRGWEQMRKNRESSYPEMKDVLLEVRDVHVTMLGRDAALVNFLWTQAQTYKGAPETASGRTTLAFRHLSNSWKIIHSHTSPDAPDPSRVMPSEQTTPASKP